MQRLSILCLVFSLAAVFCFSSCGLPAAPQPPSLELPDPVTDLTAVREGNRVLLRWTPPSENTDRSTASHLGPTRICRAAGMSPMQICTAIASVPAAPAHVPSGQLHRSSRVRAEFIDTLPSSLQQGAGAAVIYAVEVLNDRQRSAGVSNQVIVPAVPAVAPPGEVRAAVQASGIDISWPAISVSGLPLPIDQYRLRLERRIPPADFAAVTVLPLTSTSYEDQGFEWEKTYEYRARVLINLELAGKPTQVPGDSTAPITVFAHDVFPPAQPGGVQAVFSSVGQKPFIDLVWTANMEPDLAGYNIYRREEGATPAKINAELVKAPAYRDAQVQPGKRYFYSVSSVDLRGNESPHSEETSEHVPIP